MQTEALPGWNLRRVGELMDQTSRPVQVSPDKVYPLLGVRWYCEGPRHHDTIPGATLKISSLNRVVQGEVTYNKMWVKKAAFAILGQEHDGLYATSEYPTFRVKPEKLSAPFMRYLMQTERFQAGAAALCRGTTSRARLNPKDFLKLELALPPLAEQRKIAAILSSVDEAIQATQAVIEQTRRVKEGLLQELLTRGIGHTRFKKTPIGDIPADWRRCRVRDLGEVKLGRQRSPKFTDGPVRPYLRVANVFDGWIKTSNVNSMPFTDAEYETYLLKTGDILLNEGQSIDLVGRCAMFRGEVDNCCFQNTLVRFRAGKRVDPQFALALFQYLYCTGVFSTVATQTTSIAHLGADRFASIAVAVPPLGEQQKIAQILSLVDRAITTNETEMQTLAQTKAGLLQDLLTGKVRVSV